MWPTPGLSQLPLLQGGLNKDISAGRGSGWEARLNGKGDSPPSCRGGGVRIDAWGGSRECVSVPSSCRAPCKSCDALQGAARWVPSSSLGAIWDLLNQPGRWQSVSLGNDVLHVRSSSSLLVMV